MINQRIGLVNKTFLQVNSIYLQKKLKKIATYVFNFKNNAMKVKGSKRKKELAELGNYLKVGREKCRKLV